MAAHNYDYVIYVALIARSRVANYQLPTSSGPAFPGPAITLVSSPDPTL